MPRGLSKTLIEKMEDHDAYIRRRSLSLLKKVADKPWSMRIAEAKERGEFTDEDKELAYEVPSSPIGVLAYKLTGYPLVELLAPELKKIFGEKWEELAKLDKEFYDAVKENRPEDAEKILNQMTEVVKEAGE